MRKNPHSETAIVDSWLENVMKEPRKLRHTAKRVFDRLRQEHALEGSESTVRKYVRKAKERIYGQGKGHIPMAYSAGCAEASFGKFKHYGAYGQSCSGYALTVPFPYSNAAFMQVFPSECQECLLEELMRVFLSPLWARGLKRRAKIHGAVKPRPHGRVD
ncbi:MAG: hypothetical protein FWG30_06365 [Eubacteriaceae bacterium]|jgi:hypothetical protein|nr:hypothetical protein [Eubacteriaceae bacterium]